VPSIWTKFQSKRYRIVQLAAPCSERIAVDSIVRSGPGPKLSLICPCKPDNLNARNGFGFEELQGTQFERF
jgi:hypothetical protein